MAVDAAKREAKTALTSVTHQDLFEILNAKCWFEGSGRRFFVRKLYMSTLAPLAIFAAVLLSRTAYVRVMGGRVIGAGSSGGLKFVFMVSGGW